MAQSDKHSVYYATEMDSAAIDKALLQYGKGWFREAAKTDFGAGELYDMVGFDGLTQERMPFSMAIGPITWACP
jgi:hypothetical protein